MTVIASVSLPGLTSEQYDQLRAAVGWLETAPDGGIVHMAWWEDNVARGADAWESEAAFNTFGETRLGPAMAALGIQSELQVSFHPAHEVYVPGAVTLTAS